MDIVYWNQYNFSCLCAKDYIWQMTTFSVDASWGSM